jgi:hypothetical protein
MYAVAVLLLLAVNRSSAIDASQHQIKINDWGIETNQIQMGFGIDSNEYNDPTVAKITIEIVVKNKSTTPCIIIKSGSYQGVRFVQRSDYGQITELPNGSSPRGLSNFIVQIEPNSESHILFTLPREQLMTFVNASGFAQIKIHPVRNNTTTASTPFSLEVGLSLPK